MKRSNKYSELIENLNNGKVCLFETDTVVGIGCKIIKDGCLNPNINRIFDIKSRSKNKTFPWLISSKKMLNEFAININEYNEKIIDEKWPGATTLIFECNNKVPEELSVKVDENTRSIAFRIPDSEELINAIDFVSCPIATTSANFSGKKPVFRINEVDEKLIEKVDFVYEKYFHKSKNVKPSEIISCLKNQPEIIRS